jgi:hypothetical protein
MRADYLVYTHTRPDTNEIFYVGKGTGKRMKCRTNRNIHWQRIVDKANGFKYDVIAKNLTEQEALNFEILMIKKMKEAGFGLCNMTSGGDGVSGFKHSDEMRENQRQRMLGVTPWNKGKPTSDEAKEKMRLAKLGKKQSPEHIAKCAESRRGKKYTEAHCKAISESLKGKKMPVDSQAKKYKQVMCLESGKIYKSITEAAKELNLYTNNISKACKGQLQKTGGYHWSYV